MLFDWRLLTCCRPTPAGPVRWQYWSLQLQLVPLGGSTGPRRDHSGVTGNNVPRNKCPGNKISYCNDLNLRSLVSIVMHLNPSTKNKVGHFF
jgi:hypothetical protein